MQQLAACFGVGVPLPLFNRTAAVEASSIWIIQKRDARSLDRPLGRDSDSWRRQVGRYRVTTAGASLKTSGSFPVRKEHPSSGGGPQQALVAPRYLALFELANQRLNVRSKSAVGD